MSHTALIDIRDYFLERGFTEIGSEGYTNLSAITTNEVENLLPIVVSQDDDDGGYQIDLGVYVVDTPWDQ